MDFFIYREAFQYLVKWKDATFRKPLIIRGARQVGKSTLVRKFATEFACYLELNLELEEDRDLFKIEDTDDLLQAIALQKGKSIIPGQTLLFLDEIQESPKAIQQLRYFFERRPEIFVIAAGSLLEFALSEVKGFPVGRVDYLFLSPLNFKEYLHATKKLLLLEQLETIPTASFAHQALLKEFHRYAVVGGMPEIVSFYSKSLDLTQLGPSYKKLWQAYRDDSEKYSANRIEKQVIRHIILSAPHEKDRIKFEGFGNSNFKSREVGNALRALDLAGIIKLVYPTTDLEPPASRNFKKRPRLQFLDTGMINHVLSLQGSMMKVSDLSDFQRGKTIQHLVVQEITSTKLIEAFTPPFWVRESNQSNAEVDIVLSYMDFLIPVEVKSGKTGRLRSLHTFLDRCPHQYAIRLYGGHFSIEKHTTPNGKPYRIMNLPYYLGTMIEQYLPLLISNP